eukprot:TRINITY_DN9035_c0_g1_i1.p1 TRINITY_DN9035_c0_g1~~TRINITY_DN9035_c0_g1_i1.p1  ORF type:complete len:217 (-),score=55.70 TRINITY_DN9035_c0_g1_i1:42-692(-)
MASQLPKLTYFDMDGGRGEPARLAFYYGSIAFEDNRVTFAKWGELKGSTPWGSLPTLEIPGKGTVGQSLAIFRYVGRHANLYPTDDFQAAQVDQILEGLEDVSVKLGSTMRSDEEKKKADRQRLANEDLPRIFENAEKILSKSSGKFALGDQPTIADIVIFVLNRWLSSGIIDFFPKDFTSKYARFSGIAQAVGDLPKIQDYYAGRQKAKEAAASK